MTSTVTGPLKGTLCQLQDSFLKLICRNLKPCNAGCSTATCSNSGNSACTTCSSNCLLLAQGSNPTAEGQCGICNQWCEWTLCGPCGQVAKCIGCGGCSGCKTGGCKKKHAGTESCSNCETCPSTNSSTTLSSCGSDTVVEFSLGSYYCPCGGRTKCKSCNSCNKCTPCACASDWKCRSCGWYLKCNSCHKCNRCDPCLCPNKPSWRECYDKKLMGPVLPSDLKKNCSPCANVYDNKSEQKPCDKKDCWGKKPCTLSTCTTCGIRPFPPSSKSCVCPEPSYTYDQVITKYPDVAAQLQLLYSQLVNDAGNITDYGWSFLIVIALKNNKCDCVIKEVLKIIDNCPGHAPTALAKYDIISRLANIVCLDTDMLYLLLLTVSFVGEPVQYSLCGQDIPDNIATAYNTCNKTGLPEGCTTSCVQDCYKNIYYFDATCVLPVTYLLEQPRIDIVFNQLLIALLMILEIQRCGTRCFEGFCVKPVPAGSDPAGDCFQYTTAGYVMDSDAYEFYKTVRNIYDKLKQNCDPNTVMNCFNAQYLYYFMLCNWDKYEKCVEGIMGGQRCLPPPRPILPEPCPPVYSGPCATKCPPPH